MSNHNQPNDQKQGHDGHNKGHQAPGNLKNDPERAREAGQKGGEHSHGGRREKEEE